MSEFNKSYRIRTEVGKDTQLHVKLDQKYDVLELMSLKINQENAYRLHTSNYGVIAGRVLANGAFGIPNAKISVFINIDDTDINDVVKSVLYPYNTTSSKDKNDVRYNLLPNEQLTDCHTIIGTFPEKQYALDNDSVLEIFEKYYKYTTRTNEAGDYMIFGVPVGSQTIHVDIDLSDIGILSQKPRDMVYKGYDINQFENPNKFKYDTNLNALTQVISQDNVADVIPFWGDETEGTIGITRCDIDVQYKFEPTCVFMGSVVSDTASNGISKKCIPSPGMGAMDEITTGSGTIEMIRKKPDGSVEEFQIQGTQLINGDGVWCYQIPMNLDYMMTDEFGNMVPTNDPNKGIPTRTRVRFRISMQDFDSDSVNMFRGKMLVPHNPKTLEEVDYQFGSNTAEESFKDLFWNGVYSVKSYIPRIQKGTNWRNEKFTGFKRVNYYGDKNPIPYNNIRIKIPFMFTIICALIKLMIMIIQFVNSVIKALHDVLILDKSDATFTAIDGTLCDDELDNVCVVPGINFDDITGGSDINTKGVLARTFARFANMYNEENTSAIVDIPEPKPDNESIDYTNKTAKKEITAGESSDGRTFYIDGIRATDNMKYFIQCIELNLAQEYKVIQFDFYNDWVNGLIYIPRWMRNITKKYTFLWGLIKFGGKVKACNENVKFLSRQKRNLVQQCGLTYKITSTGHTIDNAVGCTKNKLRCHKAKEVRKSYPIFEQNGVVKSVLNMKNQYVYYFKPIEAISNNNVLAKLYATDIILLGTLNNCDRWGIPNALNELVSSSFQLPPNLPLTDSDIEGKLYDNTPKRISATFQYKQEGTSANSDEIENVTSISLGDSYLKPKSEDGNYTEISGIDWGYNGPLQISGTTEDVSYKPGGHFLGLSCRNSETTIKSCVNLSRICEYGVWMSQRHELNIPNTGNTITESNAFNSFATVPSGVIAKDEISGTNYRNIFATMNHNSLQTIRDKNNILVYDFVNINPLNFGGELYNLIQKKGNYNRKVGVLSQEIYYNYDGNGEAYDNYYLREGELTGSAKQIKHNLEKKETQIVRTGEWMDNEYWRFRLGLKSYKQNDIVTEKRKHYLGNSNNTSSFPIYENSFYFYFGLKDGATALDLFKEQYYATCSKMGLSDKVDTTISLKDVNIGYDGVCEGQENGVGNISFYIRAHESLFGIEGMTVTLLETNEQIIVQDSNTKVSFTKLKTGIYNLLIESEDKRYNNKFSYFINTVNISASVKSVKFKKDVSSMEEGSIFQCDRLVYGGYIYITDNLFTYSNGYSQGDENGEEQEENAHTENVFNSHLIKQIRITDSKGNTYTSGEDIANEKRNFTFSGITVTVEKNNMGEFMIPVPRENETYTVELKTRLIRCKPSSSNGGANATSYWWNIGTVEVQGVNNILNIFFNGIDYNKMLKTAIDTSVSLDNRYDGWWNSSETFIDFHPKTKWLVNENLFLTDLDKPHKVIITNTGGQAPYTEIVTGMKEDMNYSTSGVTRADFETVKIPTINYLNKDGKKRDNFTYQVIDIDGQICPESSFVFPVIYKPFFMEMGMWYFDELKKYYLIGNVYNGKTWDYETEGFNKVELNGVAVANLTTVEKDDTTMELDEPTLSPGEKGGYSYGGPYFKYNGRKTTVSREIEPITYGLTTTKAINSMNLSIGSSHTDDNGVVFEDYVKVAKTKMQFFEFSVSGRTYKGKYYIKITPNVSGGTTKLLLNDETGGYTYPIVNSLPNVSDKLHRAVMGDIDNIQEYYLDTVDIDGIPGYIDVSDKSNTGSVYYIALPQNGEMPLNSNSANKFNSVSVSTLINLNSLAKFYPLYIDAEIEEIINGDEYDAQLTIYPSNTLDGSADNFKNKRFEIVFYNKMNELRIEYLTVNIIVGKDSSKTVNLTQNEILQLGLTGVGTKGLKYYYNVYHIENGTYEKAPTSYLYNKSGKELTMNTSVTDNTPKPKIINVDINGNITSDSEVQALPCDLEIRFDVEEEGGDPAISKGFTQTFSKGATNLLRVLPPAFEDDRIITINPDEYTFTHENQRYKIIWKEITLTPTNT